MLTCTLGEETLDEGELMELIDVPTSNALVNENKENEWVLNLDLQDVKKGLNLAKELELHFIRTDHSTVRSAKLRNCLAPYRMVLVELEKKLQSKTNVKMNQVRKTFCLLKEGELGDSYLIPRMSVERLHNFTKSFFCFCWKTVF
ncbi:hypothetical protein TNCT_562611 [Trichonephila clavata]|uniref:Uncharacterized protein n=1 Tax=Trichonephila clavata TaxID=2740835 RepID=A0A8X6HQA5_TRICU|nr:hypothetical protein TNCT_562611 [Trichonephila clavata]